jgi:hypothetical protein
MKTFLEGLTRNTPEAAGGAPPAAGAAAPAVVVPPAAAGSTPAPTVVDPPAGQFPGNQVVPGNTPPVEIYKPEGLPDTMFGKSDKETLDNAAKALKGYRDRDASNGVPETKEAYAQFTGEIPEAIKPHLDTLTADPLFDRVAEYALAERVPTKVYQGLTQKFLSVVQEMGLMEPVVDDAAEKAALLPDTAKHLAPAEQTKAIEARMNQNFAFLDAMVARGAAQGGIAKDDADFAKAMLGDSAKGHRIFEWMAATAGGGTGGGPAMLNGNPGAVDPKADISRRQALPVNTWGHREFNQQSYDQLQADLRRVHGD